MALLTKDQILSACRLETKDVEIPELGGSVRVRDLTLAERGQLFTYGSTLENLHGQERGMLLAAKALSWAWIDDKGEAIYSEEEIKAFGFTKADAVIIRLSQSVLELSGMAIAATEELEKNSEPAPTASS